MTCYLWCFHNNYNKSVPFDKTCYCCYSQIWSLNWEYTAKLEDEQNFSWFLAKRLKQGSRIKFTQNTKLIRIFHKSFTNKTTWQLIIQLAWKVHASLSLIKLICFWWCPEVLFCDEYYLISKFKLIHFKTTHLLTYVKFT